MDLGTNNGRKFLWFDSYSHALTYGQSWVERSDAGKTKDLYTSYIPVPISSEQNLKDYFCY